MLLFQLFIIAIAAMDPINSFKLEPNTQICNTPECVSAAHSLIQNMDTTADPCEDFYQYACGNFVERVSQFGFLSAR